LTLFLYPATVGTVNEPRKPHPGGESHFWWPAPPRGYSLTILWDIVNDRVEPIEFTVRAPKGKAVTAEALRRIPFGRLVSDRRSEQRRLVKKAIEREPRLPEGDKYLAPYDRPGADLGRVAAVYREAHARGLAPVEAVAEALGIARSTAAKRVMDARRAGALGPARPGKSGEA
jgi:hypothetical protein